MKKIAMAQLPEKSLFPSFTYLQKDSSHFLKPSFKAFFGY